MPMVERERKKEPLTFHAEITRKLKGMMIRRQQKMIHYLFSFNSKFTNDGKILY